MKRGLRAPPSPEKKTVGDALDYWLTNRAPQKRSGGDGESIIRRHLRPTFGHLRLRVLDAAADVEQSLEPMFDARWQAAGEDRSLGYSSAGSWIPDAHKRA